MKKLLLLFIISVMPTAVYATQFTTRVCEANGNTLFDNRDIMVGTKLTIIVHSNLAEPNACDLVLKGIEREYGLVSGIGWNDETWDYEGSHFPAAGVMAFVYDIFDPVNDVNGISMVSGDPYTGGLDVGDWFIVNYTALKVGDCNVAFYENFADFGGEPSHYIHFHHVPTRNFNQDTIVNFADYSVLARWWQQNCENPGGCDGADLDDSNDVDIDDLMLFCDYWLEKTEY